MSQVPSVTISAATASSGPPGGDSSASPSEKHARSPSVKSHSTASTSTPGPKLRSCVVCRTRKVRCDKQSPCSNCRRANIDCVFPSTDRPPRWARRLERVAKNAASSSQTSQAPDPAATQVMDRLRTLENLVKELSGQLEQANAASPPGVNSPGSADNDPSLQEQRESSPGNTTESTQKQFGRLVLRDANRSRYVSSGFWSKVNDELDRLKVDSRGLDMDDSDTSEEETLSGRSPSTQELERSPSERHAFLFRHNLSPSAPDLREFHPLPSQIPFLLDVFAENVNSLGQFIHMPTVRKMMREMRTSNQMTLTPANEALMFSIYYAAVTSMENDDILTNFGITKSDLNLKFRLGLEHALARADFLNVPELVLVQAFLNYLCLVRRHDSARWVWMMTGLAIRMGQALGLQRDGSHFENLTPYEIEIRRRVWAGLCILDVRASEDQGTDYTIAYGTFDTKLPLNINDSDIDPETTKMPTERDGITDMTVPLASFEMNKIARKMTAQSTKSSGAAGMEEQERLSEEIYQKLDQRYLQYSPSPENITYWVFVTISRLMRAKMTLLTYTPILSPSLGHQVTEDLKDKLLNAAIENAEYNHALNANRTCRRWHWMFQTYTHWHAIVYLLLIISKRSWSPIIERAWVALHSEWLIPAQTPKDKNQRMWIPLRKLITKAKNHRESELKRLRNDPQAARDLEMQDRQTKGPGSPGPYPAVPDAAEFFRERWRQLLVAPKGPRQERRTSSNAPSVTTSLSAHSSHAAQQSTSAAPTYNVGGFSPEASYEPSGFDDGTWNLNQNPAHASASYQQPISGDVAGGFTAQQATTVSSYNALNQSVNNWSMGAGYVPWLWENTDSSVEALANADVSAMDVNMDMDMENDIDWYNWVESTRNIDWDTGASGDRQP